DASLPGGYRSVRWDSFALIVIATAVGWGLVTNTFAKALEWQGYLLGPLGLGGRDGDWAFSSLGVLAALLIGFLGYLLFGRSTVRDQEAAPTPATPTHPVDA
ncbi:MAG TPA: hypothetical protein VJ819_11655, partial [Nocardioidaceae bacterium]|nr:hypothetical protein [Nocardioidaceae bacterium]